MLRPVGRILILAGAAIVEAAMLLVFWAVFCGWVGELAFPSLDHAVDLLSDGVPDSAAGALFVLGLPVFVALASVLFIAPMAPPIRLNAEGRSLRSSVIAAAFIGGGLAFGAMAAVLEVALMLSGRNIMDQFHDEWSFLGSMALVVALGWGIWTAVLWKHSRRRDANAVARIRSLIFRGTLVELAIAVPAYAWTRSREECYCGLGTFWALACGLGGLLFLAGPGAFILWHRRRGEWLPAMRTSCPKCGYRRVEGAGSRCPECGFEWATPAH